MRCCVDTSDISGIDQDKMSALTAERDQLKTILRGLLISSAQTMTAEQLHRDFKQQEGQNVPYRKFGYSSFLEYLKSIPDAVAIGSSFNGGSPVVLPVVSEKVSHIDALVQKQKVNTQKWASQRRPPAQKLYVEAPPRMNSVNYSSKYDMRQRVLVPYSLQQRICRMVHENPNGVPIQTIEREFFSAQTRQNYGMYDRYDIYQLLSCLSQHLMISDRMVYPLWRKEPQHRLASGSSVAGYQKSNNSELGTYKFLPAGCENNRDICLQQNGALKEDNELGEVSDKNDSHTAVPVCDQIGVTDITQNVKEITIEDVEVIPNIRSPSVDTGAYNNSSDIVGERMKTNFQILLKKHPSGIWCSELPNLYKEEFKVPLEYVDLGFISVVQMASSLPDVFHCIRPDGIDWKLFDAQEKLPPPYSKYDIKSIKTVSTEMVPTVPSKVKHNIQKLLMCHQSGLPSDKFLDQYEEMFHVPVTLEEMGFDTTESFLLSLNDSVLHMRYVNKKILVYPHATNTEPERDNPLAHVTEPQNLFADLYPPEVIGPKGTLPYEKIPPEATPGGFLEVLVAEIYTPQNFWIQLRGGKTHLALDALMNEIQEFYKQEANNYNMPVPTIKIGQYCMAPYSNEWHRVCITAMLTFHDVQVLFVDYGTTGRVKKSDLRFMHRDFAEFPIQAIKASLVNLVPTGGAEKWPRKVSKRFLELVSDKNLVAVISSVDHEARELEVALVDTSGNEDVHINDLLVDEGLAEYKTNRMKMPQPPPSPLPLAPQLQRIAADLGSSTVTVNPPPGFTAGPQLQSLSHISSTGPETPEKSENFTEMQSQSFPNMPYINSSDFIQQFTSVPVAPAMYDVPLFTNTNPFLAQASTFQQLMCYEYLLQHQPLMRSLVMSNPAFALLISQNISAASLANPFGVPMLNPSMLYSPPVTTHDINSLSIAVDSNPEMDAVYVCSPPTAEDVASEGGETMMTQVVVEQEQNKDDLMIEASNNVACSNSDQCDIVEANSFGIKSDPGVNVESKCVNEGEEPSPTCSTSSDDIYRSDDDDDDEEEEEEEQQQQPQQQQEQYCVLKPHYVKEIDFSGRHVVLKILEARRVEIQFSEITRMDTSALIEDLETYNIIGVPKSPSGYIMGKVHLIPLQSVPHLLTVLNVQDIAELCNSVLEVIKNFDPKDAYWTGIISAVE
ncbi:tudor domain-containing protein 5 isoform X4 [Cryptotermes secundus]|nr:tudor domain-containing protein 5 isoform X4 [Cryptotermes secundus]